MAESADRGQTPEATDQRDILQNSSAGIAAGCIIESPSHQQTLIAIRKSEHSPAPCGPPLQPSSPPRPRIDGKRPARDFGLAPNNRLLGLGESFPGESRVRVQHEQPVSDRGRNARAELRSPTALGEHHAAAMPVSELGGPVTGAAVRDDDLVIDCERGEVGKEPRQTRRFVQRGDNDRE